MNNNEKKECEYREKVLTYYICSKYEIEDVDCCGCEYQQLLQLKADNEKLYKRLYKIKDSQLKEPINNMDEEDLSIEELLDHIEESFAINDSTYKSLTQKLEKAKGALEKIAQTGFKMKHSLACTGCKCSANSFCLDEYCLGRYQEIAQQAIKELEE